jgi:glycosyltransferase involved in cell wall biosynthesis
VPPPKISVCLDVFNYADFLPHAIESVLGQTCGDFELIIADDCSNDGSFDVAKSYKDPRIKLTQNRTRLGMVRNRNVALAAASGDYVKPLHADDFLCASDALARLSALLDSRPGASLVASAMSFVDLRGEEIGRWSGFHEDRFLSGTGVITRCLCEQRNLIGGPSAVMFRRDRSGRGFDETFFHMADLEMWFHLLERGCFGFCVTPLCAYRRHEGQQTEQDRRTLSQVDDYDALLKRYLDRDYIAMRPWMKRHLRREAVIQRTRRCRELGLPAPPVSLSRKLANRATRFLLRQTARFDGASRRSVSKSRPRGINVAGFFASEFGVGESSRAMLMAVQQSGLPCAMINIRNKVHLDEDRTVTGFSSGNPFAVNLMAFSMDYARRFQRDRGWRFFAGRYNIALWYWELEKLPLRWHSCFDYYDEIWVTTEFCRKAIAEVSPVPVVKIAPPLLIPTATAGSDRARFGIAAGAFAFLCSFDHLSHLQRKNPIGVIEAFRKAFQPSEKAVLVMKSINVDADKEGRELLHQAARGLKVIFIESHLRSNEFWDLLASIDCYVSLHRSEGLGLGLAQAMALAKPVVATAYSGNLEFMRPENSLLVRYRLTAIQDTCGPYEKGCRWAEPDTLHAAQLMRWAYEKQDAAKLLGSQAAKDVHGIMSLTKTAAQIRAQVEEVLSAGAEN